MYKNSPAKYYWDNKERLQKRGSERYQSLCKDEKKKKSDSMVINDTKISQKMKNRSCLSIEKNIIKWEKTSYYDKYSVQKLFF